jgi:hypothetical protein
VDSIDGLDVLALFVLGLTLRVAWLTRERPRATEIDLPRAYLRGEWHAHRLTLGELRGTQHT